MNEEKIRELFTDEEFVRDLFESGSFEVAQKKLADKDVELSVDELKKIFEVIQKKKAGEINDEELEEVAGGVLVFEDILVIVALIFGAGTLTYAGVKDC